MSRPNGYSREERPSSEQLVDLHVYLVPPDIWREKYNNLLNQSVTETVSAGFIRVHPEIKVYLLRDEIDQQLGADVIPREYVFLKSVGRSLTRLKGKQEYQLKAKSFCPPHAYAPELYLLEATPEVKQAFASSSEGSTRPQTRTSFQGDESPQYNYQLNKNHYNKTSDGELQATKNKHLQRGSGREHPSSPHYYSPLPKIKPVSQTPPRSPKTSRRSPRSPKQLVKRQRSPEQNLQNGEFSDSGEKDTHPLSASWGSSDQNFRKPPPELVDRGSPKGSPPDKADVEYLPPLSATPPPSADRGARQNKQVANGPQGHEGKGHYDPRSAGYTTHTNEDSGIAGLTPDNHYKENDDILDRRKQDEAQRSSRRDVDAQQNNDKDRSRRDDEDEAERQRRLQEEQDNQDWERKRREDKERRRREEEERLRQEEEERRRREEEQERLAEERKLLKSSSDDELAKFPSPPPLRMASPDRDRQTDSARARNLSEKEKLLKELEDARESRKSIEKQREDLIKKAKQMQNKTQNRRNHARDVWKKRYFEEKRKTVPLEEQCNRLRHELDIIHRKLMTTLEGPREKATKLTEFRPSKQNKHGVGSHNYKIQATRLQHEIEDLRRRVENSKMKLTGEMKLRNQAETELRALRAELVQKKISLSIQRSSKLAAMHQSQDLYVTPRNTAITPKS